MWKSGAARGSVCVPLPRGFVEFWVYPLLLSADVFPGGVNTCTIVFYVGGALSVCSAGCWLEKWVGHT